MRIVLDAMGGDHAPEYPVTAALATIETSEEPFEIVLTGDERRISRCLEGRAYPQDRLRIQHAPQVIEMHDAPSTSLRRKRDSSIAVGLDLQKSGQADAFISAGNTGAVMATALLTLGRIKGISRPAIVTIFPTQGLSCLVLDVGANAECRPEHLVQFAIMGHIYAIDVLGRAQPRVGLLSIGEEPSKGNDLTVATHQLLSASDLNFIGNVEGRDVLRGAADVVVCDGFVGNVLLKFGESFIDFLAESVRDEVGKSYIAGLGAVLMGSALDSVRRRIDYAEYGGAPLLGVNGIVVVGHGGSSVKAFRNAIDVARTAAARKLNRHIEEAVSEFVASPATDDKLKEGA